LVFLKNIDCILQTARQIDIIWLEEQIF